MPHIIAKTADITTICVDAIVNAANERMLGGGGVDGAIHRTAGAELVEACRSFSEIRPGVRCPTGACQITAGFGLPAAYVIHTVGPVWRGGNQGEAELLRSCYRNSIELADQHNIKTIAFPAISCGVYGYPIQQAAVIAVDELRRSLNSAPRNIDVTLVAFEPQILAAINEALAN
ncbi:MAG TPA: O-acetyl-ADP-ribose deacetylase [Planctomycetes bacterium]|nr:O-acetyl-ADP-ribose deacetylase [Planctomycetota bacterium]